MDTAFLFQFLAWSLALNYGLLLVWFFAFVFARDGMQRVHGRWFRLSDSTFDVVHYAGMAAYKLAIFFFNLVPLGVLCILGDGGTR